MKKRDSFGLTAQLIDPRSQTLFGNALDRETLFRCRPKNRVFKTTSFPNRVWERGSSQLRSVVRHSPLSPIRAIRVIRGLEVRLRLRSSRQSAVYSKVSVAAASRADDARNNRSIMAAPRPSSGNFSATSRSRFNWSNSRR